MGNPVEFIKELNYTSSATSWLPECSICQQMEQSQEPILSPRIQSFVKVPEDAEIGDCVSLEISFDTKCNAACLSCGPYCSTTWEKYNIKHKIHNPFTKIDSAEYFLNELITHIDLSKVRDIFILGGEPFYTDTHIKLLKVSVVTSRCRFP